MTRPVHDIRAIVGMLAQRIDDLVVELLPAGRRDGAEWRCGSVAGEPGQSLGVHLRGAKAGIWADFSSPQDRGDALDLVAAVRFGGDKAEVNSAAVFKLEAEIGKGLARFGVILVAVSPMQNHLFP